MIRHTVLSANSNCLLNDKQEKYIVSLIIGIPFILEIPVAQKPAVYQSIMKL